jgi:DHA1 family tetracycline resistance protein-like MFS transporter
MRKPSLGVIFLTVFIDLLGFGLVMPFLFAEVREAFQVGEGTTALLGACYSGMQFLFMPLWGRLSDRIGRRPVMLISICASAVTMAATGAALAWSSSILWVFVARAASGISTANIGTAAAYIADITTPENRVKGMGMIGMAFGLGFLIGPGIGGPLGAMEINGRHGAVACFTAAGLSAINLVWALVSLPESLPAERRGQSKRSASPIQLDALWRTLRTAGIGKAALTNHLIILAFSGLETTYTWFAMDTFGLPLGRVSTLFIFMGVIGVLVQGLFVRRVSGRVRETSLVYGGLVLMTLGFAGFVAAPGIGLSALWVVSALIAMGNGLTQPGISAYISRLADPARQGEVLSSNQSLAALARTFGPALGGYLYGVRPSLPFAVCAGLDVLALLVALGMYAVQPPKVSSLKTA